MDLQLLNNSLILSLSTTIICVVVGLNVSIFRLLLPQSGRHILDIMSLILWVTPPFLYVESWMRTIQEPIWGISPLSKASCLFVMAMSQWQIAYFLINASWRNNEHIQRIYGTGMRHFLFITKLFIPMTKPGFLSASLLIFAYTWSSFTIPSLFNQKVFASQIWITFSASLEAGKIWIPAIIHSIISVIIYLIFIQKTKLNKVNRCLYSHWKTWRNVLGWHISSALCITSILILCITSYFGILQIILNLGDAQSIISSVKANSASLKNTFYIGLSLSFLLCLAGVTFSRCKITKYLWLIWFIPGICIGLILTYILNLPFVSKFYTPGIEIVLIATGLKVLPLALYLFRIIKVQEENLSQEHYFRLLRCSKWQSLALLNWPILKYVAPYITMAMLPLILWDVETFILFVPPNGETASIRTFNLLHYGHNDQVSGICVALICIAIFIALIVFLISRFENLKLYKLKKKSFFSQSLILLGLLLSGCNGSESGSQDHIETKNQLQKSKLFSSIEIIGARGNAPGFFQKPRSVTVSWDDELFVSDMTGRIQRFSSNGDFILLWQIEDVTLGRPKGMNIDFDGNIIVIEPHYSRINHYKKNGELIYKWGTQGKQPGKLDLVRNIVKTKNKQFILCEFGGHDRIQWFNKDGSYANRSIGKKGIENGEFDRPEGLTFDSKGRILVADSCNHRIQVFTSTGEFLESHGSPGSNSHQFSYPYDVKVDHKGNVYVCEYGNSRIQIFDSDWNFIETVGKQGNNPGEFFNPWMITFDSKENLYVADSMNHRVQKLVRPKNWKLTGK